MCRDTHRHSDYNSVLFGSESETQLVLSKHLKSNQTLFCFKSIRHFINSI